MKNMSGMSKNILLLSLSILMLGILESCSQKGCPGGMCMPDTYYSSHKVFKTGRSKKRYNNARHVRVGNYNRGLYRKTNFSKKTRSVSIEYNSKWNNFNYKSGTKHTNIEGGTFKESKGRVHKNTALFKSKEYKPPKKSKFHQEGLWDPEMDKWQAKSGLRKGQVERDTTKKERKSKKKKGKGVKKIK